MELDLAVERLRHLGVEERQHLRQHLDERDLQSLAPELLRDLEADVAATHHDGAARARHGRRDPVGVLEVAQREHAAQPRAGDGRHEGCRAGRQDQLVVGLLVGAAGDVVPTVTILAVRSMDSTSWRVRTSIRKRFSNSSGVATSSLSRSWISPPR